MLILIPFIVIIFIVFVVDAVYFDDAKPKDEPQKKTIEKKDNRNSYINKYLKQ